MPLCSCPLQNRPSVITCASANNRNCNLSHCPIAHSACSGAAYRRPSSCKCHPQTALPGLPTLTGTKGAQQWTPLRLLHSRTWCRTRGREVFFLLCFEKMILKKKQTNEPSIPRRQISHSVYFSAADKQRAGPGDPPTLLF